jgi:hypothetical protein
MTDTREAVGPDGESPVGTMERTICSFCGGEAMRAKVDSSHTITSCMKCGVTVDPYGNVSGLDLLRAENGRLREALAVAERERDQSRMFAAMLSLQLDDLAAAESRASAAEGMVRECAELLQYQEDHGRGGSTTRALLSRIREQDHD